jgi:catechol 2,3-dioxygenase-like lactoylglutathione lyase family enzyme
VRNRRVQRFCVTAVGGLMADIESAAQSVVDVYVRDIGCSLPFYRALGFEVVRHMGGFAVFSWAGHLLFLDEQPDLPDLAGRKRVRVRAMVPDVDALWGRALALGVTSLQKMKPRANGMPIMKLWAPPDAMGV